MHVETEKLSDYTLVRIHGSIELSRGPKLAEVPCLKAPADDVILDLSEVDFMDSTGLQILLNIVRVFEEADRRIVIANPAPVVARTLHLMGVDRIVPIHDSVKSAVGALGR